MSSHSTIILTKRNEHIYDDCNEPRYAYTKFIGNDIFIEIDTESIYKSAIINGILTVEFNPGELKDFFGEKFTAVGSDVVEVSFDKEGLFIQVIGGSYTAGKILKQKELLRTS